MESTTRKVNVLLTAFLWFIALVCLSLPAWLLYNSWNKGRLLNERLENCDEPAEGDLLNLRLVSSDNMLWAIVWKGSSANQVRPDDLDRA